eukprot:7354264-Prymnesium_polylepis.1
MCMEPWPRMTDACTVWLALAEPPEILHPVGRFRDAAEPLVPRFPIAWLSLLPMRDWNRLCGLDPVRCSRALCRKQAPLPHQW